MKKVTRHADEIRSWTLTEAKAKLSRVVQKALNGEPQRITRGGREAVIVVDEDTYRAVVRHRKTALELFAALRGSSLNWERSRDEGPAALTF